MRVETSGSSPRVRGKHVPRVRDGVPAGLIPARAGKTSAIHSWAFVAPAHPRACGENSNALVAREVLHGSSPRVRGKLGVVGRHVHEAGLIPARAGKTLQQSAGAVESVGSSPRVRGKRRSRHQTHRRRGLIPARAGKTV